jgi:phospho-N-acetylmuramoyl-pentapeptide-transferase
LQQAPNSFEQTFYSLMIALAHPWIIGAIVFFMSSTVMLLFGNRMINWLQNKRWKKGTTLDETWTVREDTPDSHQKKQGTPSMGGLGIIAATYFSCSAILLFIIISFNLVGDAGFGLRESLEIFSVFAFPLPIAFLSHGGLGFVDDYSKASGRGGLKARYKLFWQILFAVIFICVLCAWVPQTIKSYFSQYLPYFPYSSFFVLTTLLLVIVATCNAVNLTDGIDGLAAGLAVPTFIILFLVSEQDLGELPGLQGVFGVALAGACFGFLFFNKHKARVFMGDTGSLAIGAALGAGAILQGAVFLLPFIGCIYFVEMFSVIAQVAWFKWTKKRTGEGQRLFRRAPLHHHFELCGWSEWRVVATFWAVNLFTSVIGLWLWKAGVLPRWP